MAKSPNWTEEEDGLLRKWYPEKGPRWERWAELLPRRTYKGINMRALKIGVSCNYRGPRSWTKAEDRAAVSLLAEVCRTTGRSPEAVIRRLDHLMHRRRDELRRRRTAEIDIEG